MSITTATRPHAWFIEVRPADQPVDRRKPDIHQLDAWDRLDAHPAETQATGNFEGLLVMPTGSGKTYTAAHWLTRRVVDQGVRVFRLASSRELLDLPAVAVSDMTFLALGRTAVIRP